MDRNITEQIAIEINGLYLAYLEKTSQIPVIVFSIKENYTQKKNILNIGIFILIHFLVTKLSMPSVNNMRKNKIAQIGPTGRFDAASGYVIKARPVPLTFKS